MFNQRRNKHSGFQPVFVRKQNVHYLVGAVEEVVHTLVGVHSQAEVHTQAVGSLVVGTVDSLAVAVGTLLEAVVVDTLVVGMQVPAVGMLLEAVVGMARNKVVLNMISVYK